MASSPLQQQSQGDPHGAGDKRSSGLFLRPEHQLQQAVEALPEAVDDARYALGCAQDVLHHELDINVLRGVTAAAWGSFSTVLELAESALEAQLLVLSGVTRSSAACNQDGEGAPCSGMLLEKLDAGRLERDLLSALEEQVAEGKSLSDAVSEIHQQAADAAGSLATLLVNVAEAATSSLAPDGPAHLVAKLARVLRKALKPATQLGHAWLLIAAAHDRRTPQKARAIGQ